MLRLLADNEVKRVLVDGKPVAGAFAVDERAGVVRCRVLDDKGEIVQEGGRIAVKDVKGKVSFAAGVPVGVAPTREQPEEQEEPAKEETVKEELTKEDKPKSKATK